MSAPASTAASTSSCRVRPQTLTSGRERSSRELRPGSGARISVEPDEHRLRAGELGRGALRPRLDRRLGDDDAVARGGGEQLELGAPVDRERREVAGVDADHGRRRARSRGRARRGRAPRRACRGRARRRREGGRSTARRRGRAGSADAASAPASAAACRCSRREKKPFASSGSEVAARAARRSANEPPKRSSTSTAHRPRPGALVARARPRPTSPSGGGRPPRASGA